MEAKRRLESLHEAHNCRQRVGGAEELVEDLGASFDLNQSFLSNWSLSQDEENHNAAAGHEHNRREPKLHRMKYKDLAKHLLYECRRNRRCSDCKKEFESMDDFKSHLKYSC